MATSANFESLPDECIQMIVEVISAEMGARSYRWEGTKTIKKLSLVNKRLHYICKPVLLKHTRQLHLEASDCSKATARTFQDMTYNFMCLAPFLR